MSAVTRTEEWMSAAAAFATCVMLCPLVRFAGRRWKLYDPPGPLKIHTRPIARLGGVAISLSLVVGILVSDQEWSETTVKLCTGLLLVWLGGLIDDLRELSPVFRLGIQTLGASFIWWAGYRLSGSGVPLLDFVIECVFVLTFVNAVNLLDGADGIASGVTAVIAFGYITASGQTASPLGSTVAACLIGTCLGFLVFNFPPARIFMGDSGSTALGFVIAFLGLDYYRSTNAPSFRLPAPLLFAGLPLADLAFAIVRRLGNGVSIFEGDRRHLFDLLLQRGWSPRRVALCCYAITIILVFLGRLCQRGDWVLSLYIVTVVVAAILVAAVSLGSFRLGQKTHKDHCAAD